MDINYMEGEKKLSSLYKYCSNDGAKCEVPSGQLSSIAFRSLENAGPIVYRNASQPIMCNNETFHSPDLINNKKSPNPFPNNNNACYIAPVPKVVYKDGIPEGYKKCANAVSGGLTALCLPETNGSAANIAYGADDKYTYASAYEVNCSNATFGDPILGVQKACYWKSTVPVPTPAPIPIPPPETEKEAEKAKEERLDNNEISNDTIMYIGIGIGVAVIIVIIVVASVYSNKKKKIINPQYQNIYPPNL